MSPSTPKMSLLQQLSNQLPVANAKRAQQQQAARDMVVQSAVASAPPSPAPKQAQQLGTAVTQQAGTQAVQAAEQGAQMQTGLAQVGQQEAARQSQANVFSAAAGQKEDAATNAFRIGKLSQDAKREVFDARLQFTSDQQGRKLGNERQLADYAKLRAKSDQEWDRYKQDSEQTLLRKSVILEAAQRRISAQMEFESNALNKLQSQSQNQSLTQREQAQNRKILEEKLKLRNQLQQKENDLSSSLQNTANEQANKKAKNTAMGTVIGTGIGAYVGGAVSAAYSAGTATPAGYAAGGALGGAVGGAIGSMVPT